MATTESSFSTNPPKRKQYGSPSCHYDIDKTKREELEKAYKKEKDSRVAVRILAVHMVYVRKISISETAANLIRSDR